MLHAHQIGHKGMIFWFSRHVKSLKIPRFPTRKHNMCFFRWSISTHSLSDPYGFWLRRLQNLPLARVSKWEFTSVGSPGKNHGFETTGLQFQQFNRSQYGKMKMFEKIVPHFETILDDWSTFTKYDSQCGSSGISCGHSRPIPRSLQSTGTMIKIQGWLEDRFWLYKVSFTSEWSMMSSACHMAIMTFSN